MTEILLVLKTVHICALAVFTGKKLGLFSLKRSSALIIFLVLLVFFGAEIYASLFCDNISFTLSFASPFLNFTLDFAFFIRIFLLSLLLGLISSVFGVKSGFEIGSVRDLCSLALLIAIAVLLAVYATVRVGSAIKIPFKFIPIFVTACLFGPFWAGMAGVVSDVLAFMLNPVGGAIIPQITMIEFFYGFTYGLFFYRKSTKGSFKTVLKIVTCVAFQIIFLNLGATTSLCPL